MESVNSIELQPTRYQLVIEEQDSDVFKLPYELVSGIVKMALDADPTTKIHLVCKGMNETFKDVTNLEDASLTGNVATIERMISIIAAVDPHNSKVRIANLIEKVATQVNKNGNIDFLIKILELPAVFGTVDWSLLDSNRDDLLQTKTVYDVLGWAYEYDLGNVTVELMKANTIIPLVFQSQHLDDSILTMVRDKKNHIFEALAQCEQIPKECLFNQATFEIAIQNGDVELVKKIMEYLVSNGKFENIEENQIELDLGAIDREVDNFDRKQEAMDLAVTSGHVEIVNLLVESSIGNLDLAIQKNACGSKEMLELALTRPNSVSYDNLKKTLERSLSNEDTGLAKLAYSHLSNSNSKIPHSDYIEFIRVSLAKRTLTSFAFTLISDFETQGGKQDHSKLLLNTIYQKQFIQAKRLLDDKNLNPSINDNAIMSRIIKEVKKNDLHKDKWIELLCLVITHPNFEPLVSFEEDYRQIPEVKEILDFYLPQLETDYFLQAVVQSLFSKANIGDIAVGSAVFLGLMSAYSAFSKRYF